MAALVRLLRASPGSPEAVAEAVRGADFNALAQDAARHGLSGLVAHLLHEARVEVPAPHGETLRRQGMAIAATGMRVKRLLLASLDALAPEGVEPVLLKGYGLGVRLYPSPFYRACTDVDLWVGREELARAERALQGVGLRRVRAPDFEDDSLHHLELAGKAGMVELHYRALSSFGTPLEGEGLREHTARAEVEGRAVRYLAPADELVYLALHATHHLLQRLSWLYDLKLLIRAHPGLDWDEVGRQAEASGMGGLAFFALEAARRALGAEVPASLLAKLRPAGWQAALARGLFSDAWLARAYLAAHKPVWYLAKGLLAQDVPRTARLGLSRLWKAAKPGP